MTPATVTMGIIPAYAGSTPGRRWCGLPRTDHPRIRGEHTVCSVSNTLPVGSSPHTRGALGGANRFRGRPGIIPAYAGSTKSTSTAPATFVDHPRIRGEHAVDVRPDRRRRGSSPHTRGAQHPKGPPIYVEGIIPAYAGSTSIASKASFRAKDHPRIRGEHRSSTVSGRPSHGSSPHTRGALRTRRPGCRRNRIIPAYAGSTGQCDTLRT